MKRAESSATAAAAGFRPSQPQLKAIAAWMACQSDRPSLSEAIGRLVELGLAVSADPDRQKQRARKMAGDAIDRMGDTTTTAEDRAIRKRDLLDGPKEFDRVRIDRSRRSKPIPE
ncbi:hypothetical protein I6F30_32455 [Bradyrhizobium sp. NBAIM20]|uniref:hypothetical protein n=1 Tax=unclassified Bradyrhizobium TaxID=2631580 RepID=UPI001CD6EBDD|nr:MULTISPECIES: hypothetical protein [unclassified Bradyrhizobium]MCA1415803.1 hypothetical protein [Bradyrhizobium sp. NBAIM20]MCA1464100.1 hypothetical protein [Bradyrhizobium sp. NBAIM18]